MMKAVVHVAIGLIFYRGQVLVGWRTANQHQGNKYEFPGGKVEQHETPEIACRREVLEEVGVDIAVWHPFDVIEHDYGDLQLYLHIFHAQLDRQAIAQIKAPWQCYTRQQLQQLKFPAANASILARLNWPTQIKISADITALERLEQDQMLYWRIDQTQFDWEALKNMKAEQLQKLILNVELWTLLDIQLRQQITSLHFKQHQLMALNVGDLPRGLRCIAACHDLAAIQQAQALGFDAIFLSPVQATASHPETQGLGWVQFQQWAEQCQVPVFALGGVKPSDLSLAQQHAAYGVAGIRGF